MAVVLHEIVDSDFDYVLKATTTGTNSAASLLDASAAEGAATDPRLAIVGLQWSVAATTQILWDATTNVTCLTLNGNGSYNAGSQSLPSLANNAGSGITGDIFFENDSACVGFIILKCKKVSGFDNIT